MKLEIGILPQGLIKKGWAVILCSALIIALIVFGVKFSDSVKAKVYLTNENPTIEIIAQVSGKVDDIHVNDEEAVKKNQLVAIIDSPTSLEDVLLLDSFLLELENNLLSMHQQEIVEEEILPELKLGTIQSSYALLVQTLIDAQHYIEKSGVALKIKSLESQIRQMEKLIINLERQQNLLTDEVSLEENDFRRNSMLKDEGVVSAFTYEESKKKLLHLYPHQHMGNMT